MSWLLLSDSICFKDASAKLFLLVSKRNLKLIAYSGFSFPAVLLPNTLPSKVSPIKGTFKCTHTHTHTHIYMSFPGRSVVKNPPANAGDTGSIPGQNDPLEKERVIHCSILTWEIPWSEDPGRLQSMGSQQRQTRLSD